MEDKNKNPTCSVIHESPRGKMIYCPLDVVIQFKSEGDLVNLCERCKNNTLAGAYGKELQESLMAEFPSLNPSRSKITNNQKKQT